MKLKGEIAEARVLSTLVSLGKRVLIPWGDSLRYDLVIDEDGQFIRVQVKSGRVRNGTMEFDTASTNYVKGSWERQSYHGQIDLFAVFCPELDSVYFILVSDVPSSNCSLRLESRPSGKIYQSDKWAENYKQVPKFALVTQQDQSSRLLIGRL
jgi:hypothetical protein